MKRLPSIAALLFIAAIAMVMVIAPDALACSVCGTSKEGARKAILASTVVLSLVPLALIGGVVWYVRQKYRQQQASDHPESP